MKRITIIFVLTALLVSTLSMVSFASEQVDIQRYNALTEKLTSLGVISTVSSEPDDLMSRGEFVTAAVEVLNLNQSGAVALYSDVDQKSPLFGAVYAAHRSGALSIPPDLMFNPNENITYPQACKILVALMGFGPKAEAIGGYPGGYIKIANDIKIGLNSYRDGISYYDMLIAFENMIDSDIPVIDSIVNGEITYTKYEGRTILSEYHNIYTVDGLVEAVGIANLYGKDSTDSDQAQIDGIIYDNKYQNLVDLLGCNVTFYYNEENGKKTILYAELIDDRDVLEISAEDIISYKDNIYTFYKDGDREGTAKVELAPFVMYNGRIAKGGIKDMYTPQTGSIRLVNFDSDSAFDVVIIKSYRNYVVEAVDAQNGILYGKGGKDDILNFSENDGIDAKITTINGKNAFMGVVGEYNIISALVSEDGKFVRAILSTTSAAGKISSHTSHNDREYITVGEKEYPVSMDIDKENIPSIGTEVVCYLDFMGNVAAIATKDSLDYSYAILLEYANTTGLKPEAKVRLMDSNNEIKEYTLDEKSRIDSVTFKTAKEQLTALDKGAGYGEIVRVKYTDTGIYNIDTPYVSDKEYGESSISPYLDKTEEMLYKSSGNLEDALYVTDNTFVVFKYPGEKNIDKRYFVATKSQLGNDVKYTATAYAVGKTFTPQAVVMEFASKSGDPSSRDIYVVTKKTKGTDENGEVLNKLLLNNGSKTLTLYVDDAQIEKEGGIDAGDMIRVDVYKEKYVLGDFISKIYDYSTDTVVKSKELIDSVATTASIAVRVGYVYDKIDSYISYSPSTDLSKIEETTKIVTSLPANILKISQERGNVIVEQASASDLKDYTSFDSDCSKIFIKYQFRVPYELVIIER